MPKKPVLRSCAICREKKEKRELLRIVRRPTGEVEIDPSGKKTGRGAYICANEQCVANAEKNKRLNSALKTEVPDTIYQQIREYINNEQ
ncbi:MAG: YlxR family protein [Peptococcaceae bacterium]|nr:YlxR family protein [Peptococcaceae bacterium]